MSGNTVITGLDSASPGTAFNVGNAANNAIRVDIVAGGGGGTLPASGETFSIAVGGTAVNCGANVATQGVLVLADPAGGANFIYVGFSNAVTAGTNAATDGVKLAAGAGIIFPVANSSAIWLIASASAQKAFVGVV